MAVLGTTIANAIIAAITKGTAFSEPAGFYLHPSSTEPDDAGGNVTAPGGSWCTPPNARSLFGTVASRQVTNSSDISFGTPDRVDTLAWLAVREGVSGASAYIGKIKLLPTVQTAAGVPFVLPAGQLVVLEQ